MKRISLCCYKVQETDLENNESFDFDASGTESQSQNPGQWTACYLLPNRSSHRVTLLNGKAFLFGGGKVSGDYIRLTNDFHVYDFRYKTTRRLNNELAPPARSSFQMEVGPAPHTIVLSGGSGENGPCYDVWEYNTKLNLWKELIARADCVPLEGHTMTVWEDGFLFFGGYHIQSKFSNQLFFLDMQSLKFVKKLTAGVLPSPRYRHQSVIVGEELCVFGGGDGKMNTSKEAIEIFTLNLKTYVWAQIQTFGNIPENVRGHSCVMDSLSGKIYLFGGLLAGTFRRGNSFFVFDPATKAWELIQCEISPRALHSCIIYQGSFFVFGGNDGHEKEPKIADNWTYCIRAQPKTLSAFALAECRKKCLEAPSQNKIPNEVQASIGVSENRVSLSSEDLRPPSIQSFR